MSLVELRVRDLGVIEDLHLVLEAGMTALTGETGAGKTLVVEAIELLVGGRADAVLVRPGAKEAFVEGRFALADGTETVLARAVPAGGGRSRAYVDGRMAPVGALSEAAGGLVDLHGQHAHQSLLSPATQRAALDAFGSVDLVPLVSAREERKRIDEALAALGGDARARAREVDLLRFQIDEVDAAAIAGPGEDEQLATEEDRLADAANHRDAATAAHGALTDDGGAGDAVGAALAAIAGRAPFADLAERLRAVQGDLADVATELRNAAESLEDDPERLGTIRARRQLLADLRRKYGDTLADVLVFADEARRRLEELESHEARVAELEHERAVVEERIVKAAAAVAKRRRAAAPELAGAVASHLHDLAMPRARLDVVVAGDGPADDVAFLLGANPGEPALPLTKVASGGELARCMLALRLVLTEGGASTLVFDEVDAGIGGEAAIAVGRALAALAASHQVLVVTHLPQVAAFADHQVVVSKGETGGRTVARVAAVEGDERVVELSRMLSGQPESTTARTHAEELLASARTSRGRA